MYNDCLQFPKAWFNGNDDNCSPRDNDDEDYICIHLNAEEARHLFRTRGRRVCMEDVSDHDHESYYESHEVGWDVELRYYRYCMLTKAVHKIIYPGDKRRDDPVLDYDNDDTEFVTTSDRMK